jgi:hypothetical protein
MFTYGMGSNPTIDNVRMAIGDTVDASHLVEDEEINAAYSAVASTSFRRAAAFLLDALASSRAALAVDRLMDVQMDPASAAKALREQAAALRATDEEEGAAFALIRPRCGMRSVL